MPQWHGDQNKRKTSGGKKRSSRSKRAFEMGREAIETELGSRTNKIIASITENTFLIFVMACLPFYNVTMLVIYSKYLP